MTAEVFVLGRCLACGRRGSLRSSGCAKCLVRFGERWFALADRCVHDRVFARAVFARISDRQGQARFVEIFGADVLGWDAPPVVLDRDLKSRGQWEHRQEWTIPPPPPD